MSAPRSWDMKAGGYWPHNLAKGPDQSSSATLLFDPGTDRLGAGKRNYLTGFRTGAASAIRQQAPVAAGLPNAGVIGHGRAVGL